MSNTTYNNCVIFGGKGYIGSFFAAYLLDRGLVRTVYLADISDSKRSTWPVLVEEAVKEGGVVLVNADVRHEISSDELPETCDLICNFAAVHREPGHLDKEYFETNILGAENVCAWADKISCGNMIFTSSIAPYGTQDHAKDEKTLPIPVTAYGSSKLAAEKIHIAWQNRDINKRYLSIVRPGVIYGPGEDGNVRRMIHAVIKKYFFYAGNQKTIKAGGYIKELTNAMYWVLANQKEKQQSIALYNFTNKVPPTIEEYVNAICEVAGKKRKIINVPYYLLLAASFCIDIVLRPLGVNHPFSPVRIKKLKTSNHVVPKYLLDEGYEYQYTLESSFQDWIKDSPEDWLRSLKS